MDAKVQYRQRFYDELKVSGDILAVIWFLKEYQYRLGISDEEATPIQQSVVGELVEEGYEPME